ncbi:MULTISPECIES: ESX secretion-associated protein EspG [unclassified Nocardia]|uniref:ESX secretion-associated protein EspG n=1 Tax=unclassified Nocardia TaxID=2637762 RepID=UPI001CE4A07C|nr:MULTISPECIES: ESX secretion-associated protein EspG [unclassified Nocardia]
MMNNTWNFTDIEFAALWEQLAEQFLPAPFSYLTETESYDEHEREKAAARQRVRATLDDAFDGVLEALAQPDIRLVVTGSDADPDNPAGLIRLLAARRGDRGYLAKQLPGKTIWHSGGFVVTECDPLRLADIVVAELPRTNAGRQDHVVLIEPEERDDDDFDYAYGRSKVNADAIENSFRSRSLAFHSTPVDSVGLIEIVQGRSRFGPRGITRYHLGWRDLVGDGRYVTVFDTPPVAVAADGGRMTALLNAEIIKVVRTIRDERA